MNRWTHPTLTRRDEWRSVTVGQTWTRSDDECDKLLQAGYFAHSLKAYGQHGKPCPRCGTPMVREQFMNRGSHFCPRCQRLR